MSKLKFIHAVGCAAGLALFVLILAQPMTSQRRPGGFGGGNDDQYEVTCQSFNGRRKFCGSHPGKSVSLTEQISRQACVQGETWGMDNSGLWVDQYCGATFTMSNAAGGANSGQRTVTCQSTNGLRAYCGSFPGMSISLDQQISRAPCIQDRTWGIDGTGLWADDNCGATFRIQSAGGGRRPGQRPPWMDRESGDTWPPRGTWRGRNWDRGGACFYKDKDFGGQFFCLQRGEDVNDLAGDNDKISSMRMFGSARVTIYEDNDFRGNSKPLNTDVRNFRDLRVSGGRNWNDRISSIRVD